MARLSAAQMTAEYGRPDTIRGVAVQDRLPWGPPRSSSGNVQAVLVHPLLVDAFLEACRAAAAASTWVPRRCDSHVRRAIRGFVKPRGWVLGDEGTSSHSWCTAWDFFATPSDVPPPGGVWTPDNGMPALFAQEFERRGFTWGGRWNRTDLPHLEYRQKAPSPRHQSAVGDDGSLNPADWLSAMLKQGDVGQDVWALEFMLRAVGQTVEPDGVFGPTETAAVRAIQSLGGATVDGIVGPITEQLILDLIAAMYPTADAMVAAAFQDVFGRPPDASGGPYWSARISKDLLLHELWAHLWHSAEAKDRREKAAAPAASLPTPPNQPAQTVVGLGADDRAALEQIKLLADQIEQQAGSIG